MRRILRGTLLLGAIAAASPLTSTVSAGSAATSPADSQIAHAGKAPHGQLMRDAWAAAEQQALELAKERRLRRNPSRVAQRAQSRTLFKGLSPGEAARLALQQFPEIVGAPAAGPLLQGQVADEYVGRFAARLKGAGPGRRDALVVSTSPLRDNDGSGKLAPVDISLERGPAGWEPKNPLEPYAIGDNARVEFVEGGVTVTPEGATVAGETVGETLFFADTLTDTDTLIKPLTTGVQYGWQLRSVDSPEQLRLDVDLPAEASLVGGGPRGVRIVRGGETVGQISPAIAFDAEGKPLRAELSIDDDSVLVTVAHREQDVAYPILVDPEVTAQFYFNYNAYDAFEFWGNYNVPGNKMTLLPGDFWYGRGLYIQSANYPSTPPLRFDPSIGPGYADRAGFFFDAPGDARIYKVTNNKSMHILGASLHICMVAGIANADHNSWEGPGGYTWGEGCAPFSQYAWTLYVPNGGGTTGNAFIYGVYTYQANQTAFDSYFADVQLYMYDVDAPSGPSGFAGPQITAPKTFPEWNQDPNAVLSAYVRDRSTGVKSVTFYGPASWTYNGMNGQSGITITNPACAYGPCKRPAGQQYNEWRADVPIATMPDGEHPVTAVARDAAGNVSPTSSPYTLRFDLRSPPTPLNVTAASLDTATATAELAVMLDDDTDVGGDEPQSPFVETQVRWRHPGSSFTPWTSTSDNQFVVTNAYVGNFVEVEARTVDTANHYSGVLSTTVQIVEPDLGLVPEVVAPPGTGNSDVTVDVDATVLGTTYEAGPGTRVALVRDSTNEKIVDDTDQGGRAVFPDLAPGSYTVLAAGTGEHPEATPIGDTFNVTSGQNVERSYQLSVGGVTAEQAAILARVPLALARNWMDDRQQAFHTTEMMFGSRPDNYKPNAFQHSLATALVTRSVYTLGFWFPGKSDTLGEEFADAHEAGGSGAAHEMDLHNNHVGGLFAREHPKRNERQLCLAMKSAIRGGKYGAAGATERQLYWIEKTQNPWRPGPDSVCDEL
ncbi:MAG TPA: hypothetical protein VFR97_08800 [Capillimicrobium sp.]|nr:hypothetical protein [Capillimicrobium sp.]